MACEVAEMNKQTQVAGQNREKENKEGLNVPLNGLLQEFQAVVLEQRQAQQLLKEAQTSLKSFYAKEARELPVFGWY